MVSEDSDQLGPGLLTVHGLNNLDKVGEAGLCEVLSTVHPLHAICELHKVRSLRGSKWILPKEWDYHASQVGPLAHHKAVHRLMVVVMSSVGVNAANSEVGSQCLEALEALRSLSDHEFVRELIPGSVSDSAFTVRLSHQAD
jgi:hypothetical protein